MNRASLCVTASPALLVLAQSASSIVNASSPGVAVLGWIGAGLGVASLAAAGFGPAAESRRG